MGLGSGLRFGFGFGFGLALGTSEYVRVRVRVTCNEHHVFVVGGLVAQPAQEPPQLFEGRGQFVVGLQGGVGGVGLDEVSSVHQDIALGEL